MVDRHIARSGVDDEVALDGDTVFFIPEAFAEIDMGSIGKEPFVQRAPRGFPVSQLPNQPFLVDLEQKSPAGDERPMRLPEDGRRVVGMKCVQLAVDEKREIEPFAEAAISHVPEMVLTGEIPALGFGPRVVDGRR